MKDGEEDDQPTYVVEDSQDTLSKTEYEALRRQNEDEKTGETDPPFSEKDDNSNESTADATKEKDLSTDKVASAKEQVAAIGASNKRRLAKIVGERDEEMTRPEQEDSKQQAKRPEAKKAKKVKLTFDEDTIEAL